MRISPKLNGPVQAEEVGREKEVNAREPPAATAQATQQSSSSTSSATRRERQPPSADTRISLDELEEAVANMEFQSVEGSKIRVACPYCAGKEVCGSPINICVHLATHLRTEDRPYHCSQDECHKTSIQLSDMRMHFEGPHKQLTWNDEMAKQCEVAPNTERLNAIKRLVEERTGRIKKLCFEELEEQAKTSTLERDLFRCSICALTMKYNCGRPQLVGQHLSAHLGRHCLPFACPARGCKHATARLSRLKEHFQTAHKELEWTGEVEKESVVTENVKRMEAIVRGVLAERKLSLDDLEARAANCTFTRDAEGILRMKCSVCTEQIKADKRSSIRYHLLSHLRHSCLPLSCSEDGCWYMTGRLQNLRVHLRISHEGKELTTKMEKDCEMNNNKKQLNAIVTSICARRPRK
ncbi:hypothetical protein AAVH_31762 [Aphelenchoides avenae]|nr:hypothetical protein AAVH_31762 [Aphelenchus avenae]